MKETKNYTKLNNSEWNLNLKYFSKNTLLLDIETTGLSADTARSYLIGIAYLEGQDLVTEQFFAESEQDETALIRRLSDKLFRFDAFVTYNGTGFDLPFLKKRMELLIMTDDSEHTCDLYRFLSSQTHDRYSTAAGSYSVSEQPDSSGIYDPAGDATGTDTTAEYRTPKRSGCSAPEQSGSYSTSERSDSCNTSERSGSCSRSECSGSCSYFETATDFTYSETTNAHSDSTAVNSTGKKQIDLYKLFSSYKYILHLENYKQKTLEKFLKAKREDSYDGKELIRLYQSYLKTAKPELLHALLLHNQEDLTGMARLLSLCAMDDFFHGNFMPLTSTCGHYRRLDGSDGQELTVTCRLDEPIPADFSCSNDCYYLHCGASCANFRIPIYKGTLKYFYPNYKDYYYLPAEDTAIHKSVAAFVEKSHRKKATAATCYTKKAGLFLPQYQEILTPAFYPSYKNAVSYFELPEMEGQTDKDMLKTYCMHILGILRSGK